MTPYHPSIMDDQTCLSEKLQLLDFFSYSDLSKIHGLCGFYNMCTDSTALCLLNTIAVALTTGKPGEVFATAFDKCQGLTLILAKNDIVTIEDDQAVHGLFNALTASTTKDARDVLPFLFSHCQANIRKRIRKMGESVATLSHDLKEILKDYKPSLSIEEEFPHSTQYHKNMQLPSFLQMMSGLMEEVIAIIQDTNSGGINLSPQLYMDLAVCACILLESCVLHWICEPIGWVDHPWKSQADKLKCRLAKICQYYHSINVLIRHAKRHFPYDLNYCWANVGTDTGESRIKLDSDYWAVISHTFANPRFAGMVTKLCKRFSNMEERWHSSCHIKTHLHPEIRIVLHLSSQFNEWEHHP
ncbi:hypothetical protein EDC04DRAFT_2911726 [Pisolithus marmoratus]|nr:hypothetical protein EDC04DRAFT_2911726 [Pisolithus marmoratus]